VAPTGIVDPLEWQALNETRADFVLGSDGGDIRGRAPPYGSRVRAAPRSKRDRLLAVEIRRAAARGDEYGACGSG
jgi:hypothetical protein